MAFEIDQSVAYTAKVIGGSIAGALILLRIKPVKTVLAILSSLACSVALGGVFGPPTNDYLVAHALLDWQHEWVGVSAALWGWGGLELFRWAFKKIPSLTFDNLVDMIVRLSGRSQK